MKHILTPILAALLFTSANSFVASDAGDDSALNYRNYAEKYLDGPIDIDVAYVKTLPLSYKVDGLTFLAAQTIDDDNDTRGGRILVITKDEDADSIKRKYGTSPDVDQGRGKGKRF